MSPETGAVVLAAGLSRRMGQPKLLLPWGEQTVIERVVSVLAGAGIGEIVVVTGGSHNLVQAALHTWSVRLAHNPDYHQGDMLRSLQTGLRAISQTCVAALVALGDQPQIEPSVVGSILGRANASEKALIVPSYQMRRGHPWLVRRALWQFLLEMDPETETARDFLQRHAEQIDYLNVDTPSVLADLDTPEDYQRQKPRSA